MRCYEIWIEGNKPDEEYWNTIIIIKFEGECKKEDKWIDFIIDNIIEQYELENVNVDIEHIEDCQNVNDDNTIDFIITINCNDVENNLQQIFSDLEDNQDDDIEF